MLPVRTAQLLLILAVGISLAPTARTAPNGSQEIAVIVHPDSKVDALSKTGVRAIFGMRNRTWPSGAPIAVFVLRDNDPAHAAFTKKVLKTFPYNLRQIWDRRIYSGTGQSPITVDNEKKMRERVSRTANSIGYITRRWLSDDVKTVKLQ